MSLRLAADASAHAARSGARVKVGEGSSARFAQLTPRVVQGKVVGRAAALLCLQRSACSCWQERGVGGSALAGDVIAYVVGILTVLAPACWYQKRRDPTINMRWKE
jgi:hypothetical protein